MTIIGVLVVKGLGGEAPPPPTHTHTHTPKIGNHNSEIFVPSIKRMLCQKSRKNLTVYHIHEFC